MSVFLYELPLMIQAHIVFAVLAFLIGIVLFAGKKGRLMHRVLGWTFVVCMVGIVVTAWNIRMINPGGFSFIHYIFIPLTVVSVVIGLVAARLGRVRYHRQAMIGLYAGALVIAGGFTFLPGRAMHEIAFGWLG